MKKTPIVSAIGVSLSNFGPALPEPRQTAAMRRRPSLANGIHLKNRGVRWVPAGLPMQELLRSPSPRCARTRRRPFPLSPQRRRCEVACAERQ